MTLKRPEGLSPCYLSLVSPDIAETQTFSWAFRGATSNEFQGSFTITIYDTNKVVLHTYTSSTRNMFCSMSEMGYSFQIGQTYFWTVQVTNEAGVQSDLSIYAKFYYDACPVSNPILWTYIPKAGDVIVRNTYFAEFKSNILAILGDYDNVPSSLTNQVSALFQGEVIPSRKDFDTFQSIIDYLYQTLESDTVDAINIYDLVSDSLGVSDLEKIRDYITNILTITPKPMQSIDIITSVPSMYSVSNVIDSSDGKEDTTINVSWSVDSIADQTGTFNFDKVSPSKDIRYYIVTFEYGPKGSSFICELYFKANELSDGSSRTFDMNWDGLFNPSNLSDAEHSLKVVTVDHRDNLSNQISKIKTYGSTFKIPMGVDHYEIQYYKGTLTDTTYDVKGTWSSVGTTSNKSIVHKVSGASGKFFYRVRVVDETGITSGWAYSGGVTFDPLKPPGVPKNLRITQVGVTDATVDWDPVPTAETYEVHRYRYNYYGDGPHDGTMVVDGATTTVLHDTTLAANSIYNYYVRAKNRAGNSDWACVNAHTDKPTHVTYYDNVHCHTWADKGEGWYHDQGVHHTYAYMGSWQGGGNTRGQWYFPYEQMRSDFGGGEILNVRMSISRIRGGYSTTPYKPKFYLHNITTAQWSQNHSEVPYVLGGGATSNVSFVMGERKWVDLPNSYIEWIRDGKATGIMLHDPDGKPYMKFDTWAQIEVTYKK